MNSRRTAIAGLLIGFNWWLALLTLLGGAAIHLGAHAECIGQAELEPARHA